MDRSFHSPFGVKSPFSPRSRTNLNTSKRILQPVLRRNSLASVSFRPTQYLLKSGAFGVESFGQPLPVLITEALTFADRNTVVTARISDCGYAWVVCGRRLLIWQYTSSGAASGTPQRKHGANQCFELQLPQSDLAHRAELVTVFLTKGSNTPSCLAVSPEGVVRFWPALAHENVTVEQIVDLQGQECDSLTDVSGLGSILATTTCTIVLVQAACSSGRYTINCRTLRIPSGWLGGFGKRMTSLIFGPISSEQSSETRLVRVLSCPASSNGWIVYVLAGHSLQKWFLTLQGTEELIYVGDLSRLVRDAFQTKVWDNCVVDQTEIDTWLLDIQLEGDNLVVLAAGVHIGVSIMVHYALVSLDTHLNQAPIELKSFYLLKLTGMYQEAFQNEALGYRFLLGPSGIYLYNQRAVTVVKQQEETETLEFTYIKDILLGGSICFKTAVFFCRNNGLVAITDADSSSSGDLANMSLSMATAALETSISEAAAASNLSVYTMDPEEIFSSYKDTLGQLKAAFIFHLKDQKNECQEILNEIFPLDEKSTVAAVDNLLDKMVVKMCNDLLDDIPASDPRWNNEIPLGVGSSYSMQVLHQLKDKQKAVNLFMGFLKNSGLWKRLAACTVRGVSMATLYVLAEVSEKITAAILLKSLPNSLILENAIEKAIESYEPQEPGHVLTNQDIFYREVSRIQRGLQELVNCCEDVAHSDLNPTGVAQHVHDTNEILLAVLSEVVQYRLQQAENYAPSEVAKSLGTDYLPWTAASGMEGLGDALLLQQSLTNNYGIKLVTNGQLRGLLVDQFVALIDLILDGRKSHLESVKNTSREEMLYKQYTTDRHKFIKPLLQEKEFEKASQLAEKYLDFEALVLICEETNNQTRLDEYRERFESDGFAEYVYNWFLKENKRGKLIEPYRKGGKASQLDHLSNFLSQHAALSWMPQIFNGQFGSAADILLGVGEMEQESLVRQKTVYSLAKLAKLVGGNAGDVVEQIDSKLDLIEFQEELPDYVLQHFGYDSMNPRVLSPQEIISLFICNEYSDATELEFKKALDVLEFLRDEYEKEEFWYKIWRQAVLRDNWSFRNVDAPIEILQNTLFFKLVDIAILLGADPQHVLPPLEALIDDETMMDLQTNKNFLFLLKAGYDHVYRTQVID